MASEFLATPEDFDVVIPLLSSGGAVIGRVLALLVIPVGSRVTVWEGCLVVRLVGDTRDPHRVVLGFL